MLVRYILSSVCLRLNQFSQLSFMQYILDCVYSADPFILWWLWEYMYFILLLSSNRKSDLPLFRVRSWKNGMRCMSLYTLINTLSMRIHRIVLCQAKHVLRCISEQPQEIYRKLWRPQWRSGQSHWQPFVSLLLYGVYKLITLLTFIKIFYLALIYLWKSTSCKFNDHDW